MSKNEELDIVSEETSAEIAKPIEKISVEEPAVIKKPAAKKTLEPKATPKNDKVAVYSTRSVSWEGVGKVERGYNILPKEQAELWLGRIHTRLATPEEVKEAFKN